MMHVRAGWSLRRLIIGLFSIGLVVAGGCGQKTRSIFFDGVDSGPLPPTTKVRENLQRDIKHLERKLAATERQMQLMRTRKPGEDEADRLPTEAAPDWDAVSELLPTHEKTGRVDWGKALFDGAIAPRPGLETDSPVQAVLDFDVKIARAGGGGFAVTFSHNAHTQWLACSSCHPAIFSLERDKPRPIITMKKIRAGEYCGACHGKVAFSVENACQRCHAASYEQTKWEPQGDPRAPIERAANWNAAAKLLPVVAGSPDWAKAIDNGVVDPRSGLDESAADQAVLPLDIVLNNSGSPAFKAIFSHKAHTRWLGCNNCHAGVFQMKRGANPITMKKIYEGEYCGVCHGKVAFAVETSCPRCHTALPMTTQWSPPEPSGAPIERVDSWEAAAKLLPVTLSTPDWSKAINDGVVKPRHGVDTSAPAQNVLDLDVEIAVEDYERMTVTFPHEAHTKWLTCAICHDGIFKMKKNANPTSMAKIKAGESCGVCHGKVAFPVTACGRCHTRLAGKDQ